MFAIRVVLVQPVALTLKRMDSILIVAEIYSPLLHVGLVSHGDHSPGQFPCCCFLLPSDTGPWFSRIHQVMVWNWENFLINALSLLM